ncbi:MAG: carboxypeptidase-like regulatory domain-containing protein [Bacteroidetes bacterium]|nr:carboxypeptidase-like regulatory domain-containing protein [Bacteroidota bacterium]
MNIQTKLLVITLLLPFIAIAQTTRITGKISDASTGETLPMVNVFFKGTSLGTTCDLNGKFSMETKNAGDSLVVTMMGYKRKTVPVLKNKYQEINIKLEPESVMLDAVVITPGENPAIKFMKKVIASKRNNDRDRLDAYQYEAYNKIEFDANNITEAFKNKKLLKPFKFIFDYVDTSAVNGKVYLPIFLSETLSDVFYRKDPKDHIEKIKASKVSGVDNASISQFLGDMIQNVNIYDNYISIFQKNFVSPVANFGLVFYKYMLLDSAKIGNKWCYKLSFRPKRKQEYTFSGNFWVHDTTFAVKSIEMQMSPEANVNFINDLHISQEYDIVDNYWMLTKDKMVVDFNILEHSKSNMGFYGTKTTTYRNFVLNKSLASKFYKQPLEVYIDPDALKKDAAFWQKSRHEELSPKEKTIYHMIDTLQNLPIFNTYLNVVKMITSGYYVKGNFEWGPYMSVLSFNSLEGTRFRIGGRTSNDFSTKIMLSGHVAYGTLDKDIKYGAGAIYMFNKLPRKALSLDMQHDLEQLGTGLNAFREDFLLASLFRRNPADKLSMVDQVKASYDHEWFPGLMNTFTITHRRMFAPISGPFKVLGPNNDTILKPNITTTEFGINTRLAIGEKVQMGEFERISLGAKYPIIELQYGYSPKNFLGSDYTYHRLQFRMEDWFNVLTWGYSSYKIEAGRVWGKVPYTLLKIHSGNETYWFDEYAFNLMNYYEFVSDKYLSVSYTHHFNGLFLNHIPLMRKLKWRELAWAKGVVGSISSENSSYAVLPVGTSSLNKPYFETGVGVENILRFLRVDAVWRLSHLDHPRISKFGIMLSMNFDF